MVSSFAALISLQHTKSGVVCPQSVWGAKSDIDPIPLHRQDMAA